ncbi:hypothetical protein GGU10DRAFT_331608 [Lentinula aff. detonsa]|uniref:Uncharacterized protein n=1 Tax=Lentinula aff. detonsa TaxID=2804958 RepID=A0AA38NMQ2_9AGAR|nr:hypothetical protein GGU10DRAFT_331608 [Lentinula aff. detonsa]
MFHSHSTLAIIIASGAAISAVALPLLHPGHLDSAVVPTITEIQAVPGREKGDSKPLSPFDIKELQGLDDEENTPHRHYNQVPHTVIADSVSIMAAVIPESHGHHVHEKKISLGLNVVKDPSLVYVKRASSDTMTLSSAKEYLNNLDPDLKGVLARLFRELGDKKARDDWISCNRKWSAFLKTSSGQVVQKWSDKEYPKFGFASFVEGLRIQALHHRLSLVQYPDEIENDPDRKYGTPLGDIQRLIRRWNIEKLYQFRDFVGETWKLHGINFFPKFLTQPDQVGLRSFHIAALSLSDFAFSKGPKQQSFSLTQYAGVCNNLMLFLGYYEEYIKIWSRKEETGNSIPLSEWLNYLVTLQSVAYQ